MKRAYLFAAIFLLLFPGPGFVIAASENNQIIVAFKPSIDNGRRGICSGNCFKDNFNNNQPDRMWQTVTDDPAKVWLSEDTHRLNVISAGWDGLRSSCVGHWKMNDNAASTVVIDASGNGRNGTAARDTNQLTVTGKINGALTFNGISDYVNVGSVIGTGAYTKIAWVNRGAGNYYNNIISGNTSHVFYAPFAYAFRLSAGHVTPYAAVQDPVPLQANVWYFVAVTFDACNVSSGTMVLYKDGVKVSENSNVVAQATGTESYIGIFGTGYYFNGAIDNVMIFNRALTAEEIAGLYNGSSGTETIAGGDEYQASYAANCWMLDAAEDFAVKVDFHYSRISASSGWIGLTVGDDSNYVSISAGSEKDDSYFFYDTVINGDVVSSQQERTSDDGTLYISYDSASSVFYLSHTGFGSEYADVSATVDWSLPVKVSLCGGSSGAALGPGDAYFDDFEVVEAGVLKCHRLTCAPPRQLQFVRHNHTSFSEESNGLR